MKMKRSHKIIIAITILVSLVFIAKSFFDLPQMPAQLGNVYYVIAGLIAASGFFYKIFEDQIKFFLAINFTNAHDTDALKRDIVDEKEYLNNLYARLNADVPWEIRKFTELEALNSGIEPYGRKSKARPRKSWLRSRSELIEERLREKVVIRDYLEREITKGAPVMLKGEPGSGKTMMARRFTADMAQKALDGFTKWSLVPPLPVFISLNAYSSVDVNGDPIPFLDFIRQYLKTEYEFSNYVIDNLEKLLRGGRLILVLDGLNELPADDKNSNKIRIKNIEQFFQKTYPRVKCLITCRNIQFTSVDYKTLEVNELNNDQIKKFIGVYRGEEWVEPIFDEISTSHGIAFKRFRNPFILKIYLQRDSSRSAPNSLAMLYSEYVNDKFAGYKEEQALLIENLKRISFCMSSEGHFAGYVDVNTLSEKLNINISDAFLEKCARVNIIDNSLHGKFRFYHQIFQEYFSALVLDDLARKGENYQVYLQSSAWEEIVLVWGGIVEDLPTLLEEVMEEEEDTRNLCLALKLCSVNPGKIDGKSVGDIIERTGHIFVEYEIIPKVEVLKALAMLESEKSIAMIVYTLSISTGWIRELCIQILGKSESDVAKQQLKLCMKNTKSFDVFLQTRYFLPFNTWILLYISSQMRMDVLINLLNKIWLIGLMFIPFLMLGMIYRGAVITELDPFVLIGRVIATLFAFSLISMIWGNIKELRREKVPLDFRSIKEVIGLSEMIFIGFIAGMWFFGYEMGLTFGLILFLVCCYYLGRIIYLLIRNCRSIARVFNVLIGDTALLGILTIVFCAAVLFQRHGPAWTRDMSFGDQAGDRNIASLVKFDAVSRFAAVLNNIDDLKQEHLMPIIIWVGCVLGVMSIIAFIITYCYYLRILFKLRRYRQHGLQDDMEVLISMIINPRFWSAIKKFILRRLRRESISPLFINQLQSYRDDQDDVMNELERTVYELKQAG